MTRETNPTVSDQIDLLCDRFEADLNEGEPTRIEDLIAGWNEPERSKLLEHLLAVEFDFRRSRQEELSETEFVQRFPEHTDVVRSVFAAPPPTEETAKTVLNNGDSQNAETASFPGNSQSDTVVKRRDSNEKPITGQRFGDYELLEEIARGGMGVVYRARQISLNRIVALKMIKSGELAGEDEIRRFRVEAEAAAQLDHPNIVPIYEVGEQNGQQFFSMGFVDGKGIDARLKEGPLPPREAAELIQTVAEAIQYAHDKGIVHRDLKPANVLIDVDGKPRITDFGLAKNIAADSGITATGQVMGTPSYMPPEQAAGKTESIGHRADVYSLGAMLYSLTTGRPPFQAASVVETLKQVLDQEPVSPRVLNPAVDRDLETICLKSLEKATEKRYASANAFATDLARYLDGKPIVARPIGKPARIWRWCKRNPLGATVVGLVAFLTIAGPGVAAYQIKINRDLDDALAGETEAKETAQQKERETAAALDRKNKALLETLDSIDAYVKVVRNAKLLKEPRFKGLLKDLLKDALAHYQTFVKKHKNEQNGKMRLRIANALFEIGYISQLRGDRKAAIHAFEQTLAMNGRSTLVPTTDTEWTTLLARCYAHLGKLYGEQGHYGQADASLRQALSMQEDLVKQNPDRPDQQTALAETHLLIGMNLFLLKNYRRSKQAYIHGIKLLEMRFQMAQHDLANTSQLATAYRNLAILYQTTDNSPDALLTYRKAIRLQQQLLRNNPSISNFRHGLAVTYSNLGGYYSQLGNSRRALDACQKARDLATILKYAHPNVVDFKYISAANNYTIAGLFKTLKQHDDAFTAYRDALTSFAVLVQEHPTNTEFQRRLALSHYGLAGLYNLTGQPSKALSEYNKAISIQLRLAKKNAQVVTHRRDLARSYVRLGSLQQRCGRNADSRQSLIKAREILEELRHENAADSAEERSLADLLVHYAQNQRDDANRTHAISALKWAAGIIEKQAHKTPTASKYWDALSDIHNYLGLLFKSNGNTSESMKSYEKALAIKMTLTNKHPKVEGYQTDLSDIHYNRGNLQHQNGHLAAAQKSYEQALLIQEKLSTGNPDKSEYQFRLSKTYINLGNVAGDQRQFSKQREYFAKSFQILERLIKKHPAAAKYQSLLAVLHYNFGNEHFRQQEYRKSLVEYQNAILIQERLFRDYRRILKYRVKLASTRHNMAESYWYLGEYHRALGAIDRALVLGPKRWRSYITRGRVLREMKRYSKAISSLDKAIMLNSKSSLAYYVRGRSKFSLGEMKSCHDDLEVACRLSPDSPFFVNGYAWWLATCPDPTLRDGKMAIIYAKRACELTKWKDSTGLGTLAAGYAEAGDFKRAVEWQAKAYKLYTPEKRKQWGFLLESYRNGKSYHQPRPAVRALKPNARMSSAR